MTCEQARKLFHQNPLTMSEAAVDAAVFHAIGCDACSEYLERTAKEEEYIFTPEQIAEAERIGEQIADDYTKRLDVGMN